MSTPITTAQDGGRRRVWVVEMRDRFGRWAPCAECQLTKQDCERVIRQYWKANNPDDSFRAKRYLSQ